MIQETSIEAYYAIQEQREIQEKKVLSAFDHLTDVTGNKISRYTGIKVNTVFARLNELLNQNKVYQTPRKVKDSISKRKNIVWDKCKEKD